MSHIAHPLEGAVDASMLGLRQIAFLLQDFEIGLGDGDRRIELVRGVRQELLEDCQSPSHWSSSDTRNEIGEKAQAKEQDRCKQKDDGQQKVEDAVADLPEKQRTALILCREGELSYEEIGAVLGTSLQATKSLIHRARETLKAKLKPYLETGTWERK